MSAVHEARSATREQAFFDSQQLPPEKRGVSFEALFFRQLQQVTTRIHATENIDQIMLEASQDICKLFNADRLTLYAVNEDRSAIVSKVKTGLNTSRDLKLPISAQSIAGYVAHVSKQLVNIADVYDDEALKRIHPTPELPEGSGQALGLPHQADAGGAHPRRRRRCTACCRSSTTRATSRSASSRSKAPRQLCKTLATAIRQRMQRAEEGAAPQGHQVRRPGRRRRADAGRTAAVHPEGARGGQAGRARADGGLPDPPGADRPVAGQVLRRALRAVQRRAASASEALQGALKREFVEEQGWIPLEEVAGRPGGHVHGPGGGARLAHRAAGVPALLASSPSG